MSKKRNFKEFLAEFGEEGCKRVALRYAAENDSITIEAIAAENNMSINSVKKAFEFSIVNCLVSYKTAMLMKSKAHRNQSRHIDGRTEVTSSDKKYNSLIEKRLETVKAFPDEKVKEIVDVYVKSPQLSASDIADSVGLSVKELNILLQKAIIFNIVRNDIVSKLEKVTLSKCFDHLNYLMVSEMLRQFRDLRATYVSLNSRIAQLHLQMETYEEFVSSDEEAEYQIENLKSELGKALKALERFKAGF